MSFAGKQLGKKGEKIASDFLQEKGMEILNKNYKTVFGEIDIIAKDKNEFVFVEVKTRNPESYGNPEDAVDKIKISHLIRSAETYLDKQNLEDVFFRIDVLAIQIKKNGEINIEHFKDAVEDTRLQ